MTYAVKTAPPVDLLREHLERANHALSESVDRSIAHVLNPAPVRPPTLRERWLERTRRLRWALADWIAPDIHEWCD